uniref:hypothetical protein n=1 Tax=Algoriphagus sp. TaxID=1872435 RepID=UPI004048B858
MKNLLSLAAIAILLVGCGDQSKSYQFQVADLEPNLIRLSSDEFLGEQATVGLSPPAATKPE